jgi:hypothetical protein
MDGENIVNMIKCRRGTHPLFRTFGMGAETDDTNRITRGLIQVNINRWYPGTSLESIDINKSSVSGEFEYNIKVRGV